MQYSAGFFIVFEALSREHTQRVCDRGSNEEDDKKDKLDCIVYFVPGPKPARAVSLLNWNHYIFRGRAPSAVTLLTLKPSSGSAAFHADDHDGNRRRRDPRGAPDLRKDHDREQLENAGFKQRLVNPVNGLRNEFRKVSRASPLFLDLQRHAGIRKNCACKITCVCEVLTC